jgi:phosphoglycerate kinase
MGYDMGKSLVEEEALPEAKRLLEEAPGRLILPVDAGVADTFSADAVRIDKNVDDIESHEMALDIGPETLRRFTEELQGAKLVIWNGPMGVFEFENFAKGTNALAFVLADLVEEGAQVVIGGGDSAAAVKKADLTDKMTHVSTGGGASLELLEGKELPGIAVLDDK